ncbi:MAG: hypothetical protein UV43_C0032G0017 [Parcubacteria group bacterium GW2011_GWF2_42_7]|nr:MAG: hypothetical protein UV43_C0032G0017 [Parcubacteria group bacterium GW2011_GWF2_42_7]
MINGNKKTDRKQGRSVSHHFPIFIPERRAKEKERREHKDPLPPTQRAGQETYNFRINQRKNGSEERN